MMIFRRSDFIEILVFIVCKPRTDIRIRVRRTVIRIRINETAIRIRIVIRATDKTATLKPSTFSVISFPAWAATSPFGSLRSRIYAFSV